MARLLIDEDDVVVRLSARERLAVRIAEVRVPLASVGGVVVEPDWWRTVRGVREHGRFSPGRYCVGTWRHPVGLDFLAVRAGRAAVCLDVRSKAPFTRVAASVPDAGQAARSVRERLAAYAGVRV